MNIGIVNTGILTETGETSARTSVTFEAPVGAYAWLNDAISVGSLRPLADGTGVRLRFYRVVGEEDAS